MSDLLVLGHDEVKRLLPMDECVELMETVLADLARGSVWQPLRFVVRPPEEPSLMGLMPAHRSEPGASYGLKVSPTFTALLSASTRSMAISSGLVGHLPTRLTWSQAPGTETMRGSDGALLPFFRSACGSCCHTIGWPGR